MGFAPMTGQSAFTRSWQAVSVVPVQGLEHTFTGKKRYLSGGRTRRDAGVRGISGMRAGVELTIQASPEMKAFLRRLPRATPEFKRHLTKTLKEAVREEFLKPLKANIPHSGRAGSRRKVRIRGPVVKGNKKRGRTQVYKSKKHIRGTAKIAEVKPQRIVVTVGSRDLWYGAAIHSKVPFFPLTVEEVYPKLARRLEREMYNMMTWLATGYRRVF